MDMERRKLRINMISRNDTAKHKTSRSGGFTLIETVITIVLVLLMGMGLISMLIYCRRYAILDSERNKALDAASRRMEQLKRKFIFELTPSVEEVVIDDNDTPFRDSDDVTGKLEVLLKDKNGRMISGPPDGDDHIQLEVMVSWRPQGRISGKVLNERLITYITP